jgi:hypothetical protein
MWIGTYGTLSLARSIIFTELTRRGELGERVRGGKKWSGSWRPRVKGQEERRGEIGVKFQRRGGRGMTSRQTHYYVSRCRAKLRLTRILNHLRKCHPRTTASGNQEAKKTFSHSLLSSQLNLRGATKLHTLQKEKNQQGIYFSRERRVKIGPGTC